MTKPFFTFLIPDVGEAITTKKYATAQTAQSAGRAEAKLLFKKDPKINVIELAVVGRDGVALPMNEIIERKK